MFQQLLNLNLLYPFYLKMILNISPRSKNVGLGPRLEVVHHTCAILILDLRNVVIKRRNCVSVCSSDFVVSVANFVETLEFPLVETGQKVVFSQFDRDLIHISQELILLVHISGSFSNVMKTFHPNTFFKDILDTK